ncbi:MAG: LPS export ABC transporter periplasmic protein LptC [Candidatus Omnitrophota bacterium]
MAKTIVLFFVFLSCACQPVCAQEDAQQFEGFNLQGYTDGGEKSWDVNGDTADILGNTIKITNVVANSYGEQQMNLKAKTGTLDKQSGNILLEKDVVITSDSGAQLVTDSLDWQKNEDLVTTDDNVTITQEGMVATGKGMTAHPNLKLAQLNEDVTVKVNPEPDKIDSQTVTITCDGSLEIDQIGNKAIFSDNVLAVQVGRELKADKLELFFDPQTKKIKEMICTGNVVVTQGENQSYSEKAVYNGETQKLVLYGRPKLILVTEGEGGLASFGK